MTKAIAITQQGDKTILMVGEYQATLWFDLQVKGWRVDYYKKNRVVVTSTSVGHPVMPRSPGDKSKAEAITKKVIWLLYSGEPFTKGASPPVAKAPLPRSRNKVVTAYQVINRLRSLADDTCTVLVPMGTPASLKTSKVRIVDSEGDTLCEIPYPVFKNLL